MRLRAHPTAVDTGVALVLGLIATLSPLPDVAVALTGAGLTLPLALRRRAPLVTFAVVVAAGLVLLFLPGRAVPFGLVGVPVTVHALAAYGPRWAGRAGLAVGLVASVLGAGRFTTIDGGALSPQAVSFSAASIALLVLASWALGHLRRQRLLTEARLVERAQMLELERGQQAQLVAAAERARIARELHDVVAHSLAVVVAQADGGRYAARTDPAAATTALETIGVTSRQALRDMRGLLGVLREGGPDVAPQPGLADLPALLADVRAGGLPVTLDVDGSAAPMTPTAELAVYRVVQEALTNVLKHAGPAASVCVRMRWRGGSLDLEVADDGRGAGAPAGGAGHGLTGMRERVALVGGTVVAEPRATGGFVVRARFPDRGLAPA
ncbi:histidine kinase [Angustibacter aerolatus]